MVKTIFWKQKYLGKNIPLQLNLDLTIKFAIASLFLSWFLRVLIPSTHAQDKDIGKEDILVTMTGRVNNLSKMFVQKYTEIFKRMSLLCL